MKNVKLLKCKAGDILADDVYSANGIILVAKNTIMNDYIKTKLIDYRVYEVKIYSLVDNRKSFLLFEKQYKEYVLMMKELLKDVTSGKYQNIKKVAFYLADKIYHNKTESEFIIQCLHKIRTNDEYTYTHCINTAFYSMLIGKWNKLARSEIYELICAGLIHDIGKTKIPPEILNKNGKLDKNEFDIIKTHTTLGYEMIKDIPDLSDNIKNSILMHHERIDGSGYPYGVKRDSICLFAKIISIADVYDAMTQNRIYKKKASPFDSFRMFLTEGVRLFDYPIMYEFLKHIAPLYIGNKVQLSNGKIGEIVFVPPQDIVSPVLSIDSEYVDLSRNTDIKVIQVL